MYIIGSKQLLQSLDQLYTNILFHIFQSFFWNLKICPDFWFFKKASETLHEVMFQSTSYPHREVLVVLMFSLKNKNQKKPKNVSTLKPLSTLSLSVCELQENIKVLLSWQLFHQYQQDVYEPWFMLGIPRREHRIVALSNKQNQQYFSATEKWLKSYGQAVIGRKTQQGFPLLIDRQEADCRTISEFLTLCYVQQNDLRNPSERIY